MTGVQTCALPISTRAAAEAFIAAAGAPHDISFGGFIATFEWEVREEKIEHREKYSMGAGYYLSQTGAYTSGWRIRKHSIAGEYGARRLAEMLAATDAPVADVPAVEPIKCECGEVLGSEACRAYKVAGPKLATVVSASVFELARATRAARQLTARD